MPRAVVAEEIENDNAGVVFRGGAQLKYGPKWGMLIKRKALGNVLDNLEKWILEEDGYLDYRLRPYVVESAWVVHLKDTYDWTYGISAVRARALAKMFERMLDKGVEL